MKVIKNYLYNASYQIFVIISIQQTVWDMCVNAYTNSIIQYFIIFGSIGVAMYGNRQTAYVRDNKQKLTNTFYEIFLMRIITISLAFVAFFIFLLFVRKDWLGYYLAQSFALLAAAFDISWFFQGVEDFAVTVVRNLVVKIVTLVSIFTMVKSYNDLALYILI